MDADPGLAAHLRRLEEDLIRPEVRAFAARCSIWRLEAGGAWRMTYHQGTPAR